MIRSRSLYPGVYALATLILPVLATAEPQHDPVVFAQIVERARHRAEQPYENRDVPLPEDLLNLDYDGHRDIRCPPSNFLWAGSDLPFRVQFKHRGWLFKEEVLLSTVDPMASEVQPLPFQPGRFEYGPLATKDLDPATLPEELGFAGLSLHKVGKTDEQGNETYNEVLSIQGGSYFRAVGEGQHWGSSVRAIAVNTALPQPEEFPRWTELWAQAPKPEDEHVVLYGLVEGPSVVGAYALVVTPGPTLSVDVTSHLFFRESIEKLGIAPITGMFLFGEDDPARFNDFRPEVHDADGLLMKHANGEVDWRPLRNPPRMAVSRFLMENPAGFGLIQRDRAFDHYQDLETEMNIRPSIWVTPHEGWGKGAVELLELSTDDEGVDNIGAYWVPEDPAFAQAGGEHTLSYRIEFTQEPNPADSPQVPLVSTRTIFERGSEDTGSVVRTAAAVGGDAWVGRFLIDTAPDSALPNGTIVRADVSASRGELLGKPVIQYNKFDNAYRLFFDVQAAGNEPVELRATLRDKDGRPITEIWLYRWDLP